MSERTPRLDLPFLMPAQAQKHVTVNEALARLDILVQAAVLSRALGDQPDTPLEGDGYIPPSNATGADWSTRSLGTLMVFHEGVWTAIPPWAGLGVYVRDEGVSLVHDGAGGGPLHDQIRQLDHQQGLGVGAASDAYNRVVIKSSGVLMTAEESGTGDLRLAMNKAGSAATASLLFQSDWSGRAEIGLAGEDSLTVKVSEDGNTWREAMRVDPLDGEIRVEGLSVRSDRLTLTRSLTPASASAPGQVGQMGWDSDHVYVCVAPDQWRRAALADW